MIVGEKNDDHVDYEVIGAGNGYAGGVLPKDDVVMLARHIIRTVGLEEVVPD